MRARNLLIILAVVVLAAPSLAQTRRVVSHHHRPARSDELSRFQVVFEGGAVLPQGDLGDPFIGTEKGLGADTGYELGGRLRFYLSPTTAVGPAFHYADFADWDAVTGDGTPYSVRTSLYRYGVDIQQFLVPREALVRPYLTVGGAVIHNCYEDWLQDEGTFEESSTNLSFTVGGGLAMGPVEVSATWNYNPAEMRQLVAEGAEPDFDWSYFAVRAGIALGR